MSSDRDEAAERTLARLRSVMLLFTAYLPDCWPTLDEWKQLLPDWFIASFEWEDTWDFGVWIDFMKARWWWWDAELSGDGWQVWLEVDEWPNSSDAFAWLAEVAAEGSPIEVSDCSEADAPSA